ncbi:MAG: hypothetical protein RLZZ546_569 [Bacteroidota bacterium]|jgi:hypothetical protein
MGGNSSFGKKGKTFGKIMLGIIIFIILLIYLYHHPSNQPPVVAQ